MHQAASPAVENRAALERGSETTSVYSDGAAAWTRDVPACDGRSELKDWLTHEVRPLFEQRALANREDVISLSKRVPMGDGVKDAGGFSGLHEGSGIGVNLRDEAIDGFLEIDDRTKYTAFFTGD
jgi:hypothetical protein